MVDPVATWKPRSTSRKQTVDAATDAVLTLSRALVGVAARSLAATEAHVTLPQYRALIALGMPEEHNVGSLAEALGLHVSTVTRLCDRLVANGFIERRTSRESRREVTLTLNERGRALIRAETARRRRAIREIVARLDRRTQLEMIDALGALAGAAEGAWGHAWKLGWTG